MVLNSLKALLLSFAVGVCFGLPVSAQSVDKVKTDVLSALSTPLPITIIGPLLTREVAVTEVEGGFRAVLQDTTLMGLFPFGEVSFHLAPVDDETYRITDLSFDKALDFPGMGKLSFTGMELDGIWSARTRTYSALNWVTDGLRFLPGEGGQGALSIASLSFDVMKEPDDTNTESRFEITANKLAVLGMGMQDVAVGEVRALLAANGEKPVDLYSVIREVLMLGAVRDKGAHLETLGRSLLGNNYDTVTLDMSATDLNSVSVGGPASSYFKASKLNVQATLSEVVARHWGGAEVSLAFENLDQKDFVPDSTVTVETALVRLSGGNLPVADMLSTFKLLAEPPRDRPVLVSDLLNGLTGFGKLEFSTEGKSVWVEAFEGTMRGNDYVMETAFETGFESWGLSAGVNGLDRNEGKLTFGTSFQGGQFVAGKRVHYEALPHINAWFPVGLTLQAGVTNLNEELLKTLIRDVDIRSLREPVEVLLPLIIFAAATVPDVAIGENAYETNLFRFTQKGNYRLFPTEVFNFLPYEGELTASLSGLPGLLEYFDDTLAQVRPRSEEAMVLSALKTGLIVLRNLGEQGEADTLVWNVVRPDVSRNEIVLNGITLRYPDVMTYVPILFAMTGAF